MDQAGLRVFEPSSNISRQSKVWILSRFSNANGAIINTDALGLWHMVLMKGYLIFPQRFEGMSWRTKQLLESIRSAASQYYRCQGTLKT